MVTFFAVMLANLAALMIVEGIESAGDVLSKRRNLRKSRPL